MSEEARFDLAHDLGKHLARAARNIRGDAVPPALRAMLVQDLYSLRDGKPASVVFAEIRVALDDRRLDVIADKLARIDAIRTEVERGDPAAIEEAVALALAVSDLAREVAR